MCYHFFHTVGLFVIFQRLIIGVLIMKQFCFGAFALVVLLSTTALAQETPEQCQERCGLWYADCVISCPGVKARMNGPEMTEKEASDLIDNDPCAKGCIGRIEQCLACDATSARDFKAPENKELQKASELAACQKKCDALIDEAYQKCDMEARLQGAKDDTELNSMIEKLMQTDPCLKTYLDKMQVCKDGCK